MPRPSILRVALTASVMGIGAVMLPGTIAGVCIIWPRREPVDYEAISAAMKESAAWERGQQR